MKHLLILSVALFAMPMLTSCEDNAAKVCEDKLLTYTNAKASYNISVGTENCTTVAASWSEVVAAYNNLCAEEKMMLSTSHQSLQFVHNELLDDWGC